MDEEVSLDMHVQHFRDMNRRIMMQRAANRNLQARLDEATAAKDQAIAERDSFRAGNTALLEALMDMCNQHCHQVNSDVLWHHFLSANENAFEILEEAGMATPTAGDGWTLNWDALEARKPKRQTWSEAVHEVVTDPQEIARLLALDDEKE